MISSFSLERKGSEKNFMAKLRFACDRKEASTTELGTGFSLKGPCLRKGLLIPRPDLHCGGHVIRPGAKFFAPLFFKKAGRGPGGAERRWRSSSTDRVEDETSAPGRGLGRQPQHDEGPFKAFNRRLKDMKVRPSVKPMCEKCKIIKRKGKVMVICENPKHKQRQG